MGALPCMWRRVIKFQQMLKYWGGGTLRFRMQPQANPLTKKQEWRTGEGEDENLFVLVLLR